MSKKFFISKQQWMAIHCLLDQDHPFDTLLSESQLCAAILGVSSDKPSKEGRATLAAERTKLKSDMKKLCGPGVIYLKYNTQFEPCYGLAVKQD